MAEAAIAGATRVRARSWLLHALFFIFIAFVCLVTLATGRAEAQTYLFDSVVVEGTQRIEPESVLSYAEIPRGQTISAGQLNAAYQRILGSGLFETVDMVPQGNRLTIRVSEFPTINSVAFEGNRRIDDEALAALVRSQSRRVYSPTIAEQDAAAITEAYSQAGRFAGSVTPKIIRRSENRVDLVFEVVEGRVVEIERISFVGNRAYSDRRLRNVMETKQAGLLRQIIQRDTFVADRLEFDKQVLADFYASRGYVDFQILSTTSEVTRGRDAFFITFNIREGQQFRFGEVTASSDLSEIDVAAYQDALRIRQGSVYSPSVVETNIARLETLALRQGLDFIRVEPRITRNDRDLTLDIEFAVVRGPRIFVERIDIEGNVTTVDRVIRNRFRTVEGDPFNPREIRESAERIRALGFFSKADVEAREGSSPEQVIVDVNVEEQPTGALSFGLSYSVSSGTAYAVNFQETNFLGRGQTLAFSFDTGSTTANTSLTFIEPAFLGRDLRFRFNAFYRESDNDFARYSTRIGGASVGLDFPAGENSRFGVTGGVRFDSLFDVSADSSPILATEEAFGDRYLGYIGTTYTYDLRGGGLDPNRGVLLRYSNELYGGDATYLKSSILAVAETRVWNEEVGLRASLEGGVITMIDGESRVTDRFFGSEMRGFEPRGFGPRDLNAENEDPLGGNYFAVAKLEAGFPLGLPEEYGLTGGLFLDVGSVWGLENTAGGTAAVCGIEGNCPVDDSLHWRATAGFSIFWDTALGPLRFNFSRPLMKQDYDKEQNFDLTISTKF